LVVEKNNTARREILLVVSLAFV